MSTKERILDAARELLNKTGIDNVSARTICAELKISPGNFTYYYSNKNQVIADLYSMMRSEIQEAKTSTSGRILNITTYLRTHQQLFLIQDKYKFFYLNLFEILTGDPNLKEKYLATTKTERKMAIGMLKTYSQYGIFRKGLRDDDFERLVNVGQILNNAWLVDAEILYKGNQRKKMVYYMGICCGLLQPYLTEKSAVAYQEFFESI